MGKTVFCCSHVELEYFDVYFLSLPNGGEEALTFQITPFLLWNHTGLFAWISFGEKKLQFCLFPAYG